MRKQILSYIENQYGVLPETPWQDYPDNQVFRHGGNRKWFAIIMPVDRKNLHLPGEGRIDVINVKLEPMMVESLRSREGFLPAYHMNKTNWLSVRLDGSVELEKVCDLIDLSYEATRPKGKKGENNDTDFI